jgi:nucleotide-binding universal stress UspA family protein
MTESHSKESSITRTLRAALRIGEDFYTLEESITLPLDAGDEQIQEAVELGWRIFEAQQQSLEQQIARIRETHPAQPTGVSVREPDAPATDRQRGFIADLQTRLSWSNEELSTHASNQGIDLVHMTRGQASSFIDTLKKVAEDRVMYRYDDETASLTERQLKALIKLAQDRGVDLDEETQQRFGLNAMEMSSRQAAELITEWQRR